jgi:hypothetical protein
MEPSITGTWSSPCEIEERIYHYDIIQIKDNSFLIGKDTVFGTSPIRVLISSDDCNWIEIKSPASDHQLQDASMSLYKAPGGNLGIIWEEEYLDDEKTTYHILQEYF